MEISQLTSPDFWESDTCHVMVNNRDREAVVQSKMINASCGEIDELGGHLLFSTSGSTGDGKWVALSRRAILASAAAVNEHLGVTAKDHWLLALPTFHVGGMGVVARAYLAGCELSVFGSNWDAVMFHEALGVGVTLTSLVPTQLGDLVSAGLYAPESLRVVLIGGGALDESIYQKAVELGWPVVETYGMTESASQIATASVSNRVLKVLPCWEAKTDDSGVLSIKGDALLTGYVGVEEDAVRLRSAVEDGWYMTSDRVEIVGDNLVFQGRADRCVKVLGELVDLAGVESVLQGMLGGDQIAVVAVPDERKGNCIVVFVEEHADASGLSTHVEVIDTHNKICSPVARIDSVVCINELPRTELGKIRYQELADRYCDDKIR